MTILLNGWYLGLVLAAALSYRFVAPRLSATSRALVLSALGIGFLWKFMSLAVYGSWLGAYVVGGAMAALLIFRAPERAKGALLLAGLALLAVVMMVFKYPIYTALLIGQHEDLQALALISWVGLSYTTFRAFDMLMAARSPRTKGFRPAVGLAYLLFFPPMIAGPINRYASFAADMEAGPQPLDRAAIRDLAFRFSIGVVKLVVLSRLFWYWSIAYLPADLDGVNRGQVVLGMYAYLAYIYFELSGYTDMVIALAALFGVRLPENFQFPLLSANIQDFWNRWHMSLSQWCRDHIFFPLLRGVSHRMPALGALPVSIFSIIATFLFIGAWHGDSLKWLLYGGYHGVGLAVWMCWRQALRHFAPRVESALDESRLARSVATVVTLSFVTWGLLLTLDEGQARRVVEIVWGAA